jgi:outer membrane immunogenic protein
MIGGGVMKKLLLGSIAFISFAAGPAMAADMRTKAPIYKAPPPPPVYSWSGIYIGLNAGGAWAKSDFLWSSQMASVAVNNQINAIAPTTFRPSGFTGGGQIGFNYQAGPIVWGGEADLEYTGLSANRSVTYLGVLNGLPNTINQSVESKWLATLRGRLGIANGPWLAYATGGLAISRVSYNDFEIFSNNGQIFTASSSATKAGWTAGGGIEWAFAPSWSVKAEYLYVDLGNVTYTSIGSINPANSIRHEHRFTENIARVGVNYKFDWGPVVAKY